MASNPARADHQKYAGRLVIPSFSARGTIVDVAFRSMTPDAEMKYLFMPGIPKRLYNVGAVQTTEQTIHITEGQLDAATLVACGLPAVGVPGSQSWKPHVHRLFGGFDRVLFWADRDDKGASMELFAKIQSQLSNAAVMMVLQGEDVNSHFVKYGREGILALIQEDTDEPERDEPLHRDDEGRTIPY